MLKWVRSHPRAALAAVGVIGALVVLKGARARRAGEGILTEPLRRGPILESVYGIGTVMAKNAFQFKSGVTNTVRAVHVKEGDRARRGMRLIDLDGTTLFAPFEGTITYLPARAGEAVFAQAVILSLVDLSQRYIVVSLEQRAVLRVRQGQKARVSFDSLRGEAFGGAVESVYSNDTSFLVRIGVADLPAQILPGMTADVAIGVSERADALLAPVAAIRDGKAWVKRGASVSGDEVEVKLGVVDGEWAEVVSGDLAEGDRLLIHQ